MVLIWNIYWFKDDIQHCFSVSCRDKPSTCRSYFKQGIVWELCVTKGECHYFYRVIYSSRHRSSGLILTEVVQHDSGGH